jgi:hypothetical protein
MDSKSNKIVEFHHDALDQTQSSIRLVELLPNHSQGFVQCRLYHTTIDDAYNCLSYVWGDDSPGSLRAILVNGKHFRVRKNLFNFLHFMQAHPTHGDTLSAIGTRKHYWIDALCIDQSNTSERNHQVAQMGRIFSSARLVHVWLGKMPSAARMRYILGDSQKEPTFTDWLTHAPYPYNYLMARHVFRNEYWTRAWVIFPDARHSHSL